MDEVLRRHRYLLGLQVRNDRRARSSSAARLKPDRTPERCSRGLRRAPLPGAYAYRYRHRLEEVCVSDRQSFGFSAGTDEDLQGYDANFGALIEEWSAFRLIRLPYNALMATRP